MEILCLGCAPSAVRQGDRYAKEGAWDNAVSAYREAAKKDPLSDSIRERLQNAKVQAARIHFAQGKRDLEAGRVSEALSEIKIAFGLESSNPEYQFGMNEALRLKEARDQAQVGEKLHRLGRIEEAFDAYQRAVELDPTLSTALTAITELTKQQRAATSIGDTTQPISLRFQNAKLKEVFEIVARTAGVNVVFDKEVRDDPVTIFIKDLPFSDALNLILHTNGMIAQKIAADTILVMPNTKQKQAQYQDLLVRTFYLSNAKAKEAVNLVRTLLDTKKIYVDEKVNAIVVRDEPAKLQLAERLLLAIDQREPEIELDVEVLEVNRTKSLKYGVNFAKQAGSGIVPPGGSGGISTNPTTFTYQQLTSIGPESYLFTIPASVVIDFFKQDSDAKILASPKLRVLNNRAASINVGDKQPILLSTTNVLPGQAVTGAVPTTSTVTSIEFKDTGVKLTVEPSINLTDEVILKLKVEVTRLGDEVTLQASPEIKQFRFGTRAADTVLMLRDDETVVIAGLIQDEERKTRSTVPVLGDIPWLGHLFTSTTENRISTEIVLTITPRVVRTMGTSSVNYQAFWSGTENTYATGQLFSPRPPVIGENSKSQAPGYSMGPLPSKEVMDTAVSHLPSEASVARTVMLRPAELISSIGQEFRLDIVGLPGDGGTESSMVVTYDAQMLEFVRIVSGAASIASRAADGKILLSVRPSNDGPPSEPVLAMMFFKSISKGQGPIALRRPVSASGETIVGAQLTQAVVQVR